MPARYVRIFEEEREEILDDLDRRINEGDIGIISIRKNPAAVRDDLLRTAYTDFIAMRYKWQDQMFNKQKNGIFRRTVPISIAQEGYRIRASNIDKAMETVNLIMSETTTDFVYFNIDTPDQPRPRKTYAREGIQLLEERRDAYLKATNGYVRREYHDI